MHPADRRQSSSSCSRSPPTATLRGSLLAESLAVGPEARWTRGSGDQSNSLAFVNDRYVLKLFRRIEPGPNPEFEIARVLARRGFSRTPALAGRSNTSAPPLEPSVIALVQDLVRHQGSGWDFIIDELGRYYERVAARGAEHASTALRRRATPDGRRIPPWRTAATARAVARRSRHRFSSASKATTWPPPPCLDGGQRNCTWRSPTTATRRSRPSHSGSAELQAMGDAMRQHAANVLDLLERRLRALPEAVQPRAETLLAARADLLARFERVQRAHPGRCAHPDSRRLPSRSDPADRGRHRDSRLRR